MTTAVDDSPVALIVEDNTGFLKDLKELFEGEGFRAIGAPSMAAALRELRSTPAVDLVLTDYQLNAEDKDRDSGSNLKDEILKIRDDMPIVLYSARFEDWQIPASVRKGFCDILPKAETKDIYARIPLWEKKALDYRHRRVSFAKQELARLVEKYEISAQDVAILRDFLPGADLPSSQTPDSEADEDHGTVDDILRKAGYLLRLIDSHTLVPGEESSNSRTVVTVPVWLCFRDNSYIAELYNHPCIYGDGDTENKAVEDVLKLMYGYYCDFRDNPNRESSGDLKRLVSYLNKVFG